MEQMFSTKLTVISARRPPLVHILAIVALLALICAACGTATPSPARHTVTVTSISQSFALDGRDYAFHVSPPAAAACVYLLSLNGASPDLEIPDSSGNTDLLDDGAGSGYHIGPDPRMSCPATWTVTLTPR